MFMFLFLASCPTYPNKQILEFITAIEYAIFGEGSKISTNQNRENDVFSLLIG